MATAQEHVEHERREAIRNPRPSDQHATGQAPGLKGRLQSMVGTAKSFWTKFSNDWVMNLSGLLAYNLLMSIFPILLVLLAIGGFFLNAISPGSMQQLESHITNALPGGSAIFQAQTLQRIGNAAGPVFIIGVVTALITGSRLFITLENCFNIIFRLRARDMLHQNLMAVGMLLIYVVLVPIVFLVSLLSSAVTQLVFPGGGGGFAGFLIQLAGIVTGFLVAIILFAAIYVIVPNKPVRLNEVWKGTLVAAALFVVYEIVFPLYQSYVLKPGNYGALAGFAIVILVFFYYLGFILLLGAEINSWALGQRQTAGDISAIIHEVQAHNTTRGAAGPTAGTVTEDVQSGKGAEAMSTPAKAVEHEREEHHTHAEPPKFAEAGPGSGPEPAAPQSPQMAEQTRETEQEATQHDGLFGAHGKRNQDTGPEQPREGERDETRHPVGSA